MFNAKVSVVKSWMVIGKLLILVGTSSAWAGDINNPRFFQYNGGSFVNELIVSSFGFFKTLNTEQKDEYSQAVTHALMYSENGQAVEWYKGNASGQVFVAMTWPTGSGYCRRLHVQTIAYNMEKVSSQTACYSNASSNWRWIRE